MASSIFNVDWSKRGAPKHLLTQEWLKLSSNAFFDGCLMNPYVTLREGGPQLTNNLTKIPQNRLDRLTLFQLLKSRIVQCKLYYIFQNLKSTKGNKQSVTYFSVMNPETYQEWCDVVAREPFNAKVLMLEMFSRAYPFCECRGNGPLVSVTKISNCLICCRRLCTLDAHRHVDRFEFALLAFFAILWEGM